jgi:phosphate uptake regulator
MEGRKLQLTGGSTYVVSLPKKWIVAAGLKAGDTVFVDTEPDGSISVRPQPREKAAVRKKVLEQKDDEHRDHLLRKLIGAYISGYGLIEVKFPTDLGPFVRRVSRDFSRMVIGPEVIEESRNSIVIQDLSDPAELSAEKCIRRMYMTDRAMLEDAVQALKSGDEALARDVSQRDQDVDRLYWMVAKQYNTAHRSLRGTGDAAAFAGIQNHRLIAKLLERVGDHAERIAANVPVLSPKGLESRLAKELDAATASALEILDKAFNALVTENIDAANAAVDSRGPHQKLIDSLQHHVATRKGEELLALGEVVDSIDRAAGYATDIAEIAINHAIAQNP